jgi:hypothetical protein
MGKRIAIGALGFNPTKLTIDVYLPELKSTKLEGVGNIKIFNGKTPELEIQLSGVGDIDALNYQTQSIDIRLSGTGDVTAWATISIKGRLSGIGNIMYKGSPANDISVGGIGKVSAL